MIGGSRGLGYELVKQLASTDRFSHIFFTFNKSHQKSILQIENQLSTKQTIVKGFHCNFNHLDSIPQLVDSCVKYNKKEDDEMMKMDVLVNNVGMTFNQPFLRSNLEMLDQILNVNLKAPFLLSKLITKHNISYNRLHQGVKKKVKDEFKIVNIGSLLSSLKNLDELEMLVGSSYYTISKYGLVGLTKSISHEIGRFGGNVTCVCPSFIKTDLIENDDLTKQRIKKQIEFIHTSYDDKRRDDHNNPVVKLSNYYQKRDQRSDNILDDDFLLLSPFQVSDWIVKNIILSKTKIQNGSIIDII